jgi:hypothetical protein
MSRTKKDQPYWVRENNEGTLTSHDHLKCGKTVYKRKYIRDEDGNLVYERNIYIRSGFNWMKSYENNVSYSEYRAHPEKYADYWFEEEVDLGWKVKYEMVEDFTYSTECTAGQKIDKKNHQRLRIDIPCTPMLPPEMRRYHESAYKIDRRHYNGGQRAGARDMLRGFTKEYNASGDFDDSDVNTAQHRHSISWWY